MLAEAELVNILDIGLDFNFKEHREFFRKSAQFLV